jgi:glycosyltransferase involved in cell wall biosynthesis
MPAIHGALRRHCALFGNILAITIVNRKTEAVPPVLLLLSTYPYQKPQHGGQIRLASIAKAYQAAGWIVESIAVYEPAAYAADCVGSNDVPFPQDSRHRLIDGQAVPATNDLLSGRYATAEDGGWELIQRKLPPTIDAIHVEQPWMWPLAKKITTLPSYRQAKLIYGSQNIEYPLKKDIFDSLGVIDIWGVVAEIESLERLAVLEANLSLAVTQADYEVLERLGSRQTLLAPNGIAPWKAQDATLERWRARLPTAPWILYVASAHPPNYTGLIECIGDSLACIPPNSRLVVAGGVSEHVYHRFAPLRWSTLNLSRMELLFVLSDEDLAAVKSLAHAFLLPIQHGGGSNIKTAEALYSGKYVIGSEAAFRGFQPFIELPEVTVARSPSDFQQAMRRVLQSPPLRSTPVAAEDLRHTLRWDQCLAPVPEAVTKIIQRGH